ncbi:hypothetical protein OG874_22270 [Nocardia sp. NBC_00565]|uniref:CdiA C-terminal domain-containing protein n=1 Tax=Nocardia sp. NBC_00565 TaxID=2975993 RepID=UPI002E813F58|nr:hypothetical protein [Nocardia sp. NBC_00565]WUC07644.1 hypothetical protein OG874_22270 [Nocardia sp. NBC_00565]
MGDTWIIDSGMYFDAAKKCQQLAGDISLALAPLQRALVHDCGGMAGDHEKSEQWTTAYDQNARDIVTLAATLCNALQRFGDVLAANGYNWWQSNRSKASGTEPARPTESEPLYDSGMALPTTAKGANGAGIETSITGLLDQVKKIPNGDVTKLGIAAGAWKTFADNTNITGAADRIKGVNAKFTGSTDPNIRDIEEKLTTLQQAAELLSQAAAALAGPVKDHHDALDTMRSDVQAAVASAAKELAGAVLITVAIVGILAVASAGTAAAPAAAGGVAVTAEIVTTTAGIIRTTVSISRVVAIFGAVVVAGTATGVFTAIPDLTQNGINAALASIAAMTVKIATDDDGGTGKTAPSGTTDTNTTPSGRRTPVPSNEAPENQRALERENKSADILAKGGYEVEQNPSVPGNKNPDYKIEGKVFDNVAPESNSPRNIGSRIQQKVEEGQADRIVVNLEGSTVSAESLKKQLTDWPISGLKEVIVIDRQGQIIPLYP